MNRVITNSGLFLVIVIVCFAVAEMFLRARFQAWPFEPQSAPKNHLKSQDQSLRWRFSAGQGRNSLGLRNAEIAPKGQNTCRLLFLGDSLVWSGETSKGTLYTEELEAGLASEVSNHREFEVINAGIPGYTTYQEVEFLRHYGLEMDPDLVLLGFVFNDLFSPYLHRPRVDEFLALDPKALLYRFDPNSLLGRLLGTSFFAHEVAYLAGRLRRKWLNSPYFEFDHRTDFYLAWKPYAWPMMKEQLVRLLGLLDEDRIPLAIVVFPVRDQVDPEVLAKGREYVLYPNRRIHESARELGIPILDLTSTLEDGGGRELYRDYLHLGTKGNDIVGREVLRFLSGSGIAAKACAH